MYILLVLFIAAFLSYTFHLLYVQSHYLYFADGGNSRKIKKFTDESVAGEALSKF